MRGIFHVALHVYYILLSLMFLYGDALAASASSLEEFLRSLKSLVRLEIVTAILVFIDIARAPDCDILCRGTVLGYLAHIPAKPFLKSHRGWYHSLWAAIYVSSASSAIVTSLFYLLKTAVGLWNTDFEFSIYRVATTVFSVSLLSYTLHLIEDSLTMRGVDWFGRRIRGPVSTGRSDLYFTLLLIIFSSSIAVLVYIMTKEVSTSAVAGGLVLTAIYGLLALSRSWRT